MKFNRVPAIDKCFQILELFRKRKEPLGITDISNELNLNKSTVFNIIYTMLDLHILEDSENKFILGAKLYTLGKAAEQGSNLIRSIHPYLKKISLKTNLSAFLGILSGLKAVIIDKSDSSYNLKISADIGSKISIISGAHGKALLSPLQDDKIQEILSSISRKNNKRLPVLDKKKYRAAITTTRKEGIIYESDEYIEGISALAVPLNLNRKDFQCAIWAVGLKNQITEKSLQSYKDLLKEIANKIESKISLQSI
ncbi:IclR family transcriptional regulator [Desulfobacula phenolica]|uniref:Transcriptional regulator, IclR family n=1 Tax=Desulfobacula phenolica TaxID=90732 RepID=A0A1H2JU56_9BACT|nr:IclR family transcriptional regulator [Desulfobacula phenolica]SDU59696.1 transcriptional regulator, IclR family [Desulfobacula phenolica]